VLLFEALLISAGELCLILGIYNFYIIPAIERRVIDKWLDEVNSGALDLAAVLGDVTDDAADKVYHVIKNNLLAGTGNLAKVLSNPDGDPELMAVKVGEGLLKDLGLKSPSALMIFKLLKSFSSADAVNVGLSDDIGPFVVGSDILKK